MLKILKLLFAVSGLNSSAALVIQPEIINLLENGFSIENHELKKEPYYLLESSSLYNKNVDINYQPDSTIFKFEVNEFITLKQLHLDHMKDYWFFSDIELNFSNILERDSKLENNGVTIPNLTERSYDLQISLDKRQESKTIEKEFSYHDKWNDVFIYTKLNLEFKKIYTKGAEGLSVRGFVQEEIFKDRNVFDKNDSRVHFARPLSGGLVLTNLSCNFTSRKNSFKDVEESVYTHHTGSDKNYLYSRNVFENKLMYDDNFYKFLGIEKVSTHNLIVKTIMPVDPFGKGTFIGTIDLYQGSICVADNVKVVFVGKDVNQEDEFTYIQYQSRFKNLDVTDEKIKEYISKNYLIPVDEIIFDKSDIDNSSAIKKFHSQKFTTFKYDFKKPKGGILTIYVNISHTYKKFEENVVMSDWTNVNFFSTNKNYDVDESRVISEGEILGNEISFKEIKLSDSQLSLRKNESVDIFVLNAEEFFDIQIKVSKNIEYEIIEKNIIRITGLSYGSGIIEIDSIEAKYKKTININIEKEFGYFELAENNLKIKKGEQGTLDILSDNLNELVVINKNKNVKAFIEDNKLKVSSSHLDCFDVEIMSNITKEVSVVNLEVIENNVQPELDYDFVVTKVDERNEFSISNYDCLEENKIQISSSSSNIIFSRNKNSIVFYAKEIGEYEINIIYKNDNKKLKINCIENYSESIKEIESQEVRIFRTEFNLLNFNENIKISKESDGLNLFLIDKNTNGYFEMIDYQGCIYKVTMKKLKEDNSISENNKDDENKEGQNNVEQKDKGKLKSIVAWSLASITLGISILIFIAFKKGVKKS
ncbi:hypothetical protein [Spiroplasma endosymbiont of Diplazon laetatorius]|uniref:hypothetical protein n=1 Tax=Spiroplasma endosymbiont of Diplazon laetatorius TaxID=3066322 RepID=UPI0030CC9022